MRLILLAMVLMTVPLANATDTESTSATVPNTIAGQTLSECVSDLNSDNRVRRLRAARTIAAFGPTAGDQFTAMLGADDPAVRYLAATHLGRFGGSVLESNLPKLSGWVSVSTDDAASAEPLAVRLAAAYAVCSGTSADDDARKPAMSLLIEGLSHPERGVACTAADLLGQLGSKASAAVEALEQAAAKNQAGSKGGDYHVGGAATNALRKIRSSKESSK